MEVGRLSFDVRLHSLLFQFLVQFGEGIFEQLAVSWILAGGQFLKNSLAREAEVLFFPPAGSFFGAHLRTGVGRLISGLGLLSFVSIEQKDFPTLMALIYIDAIVVLLSILLSDMLYVVADPRISFASQGGQG